MAFPSVLFGPLFGLFLFVPLICAIDYDQSFPNCSSPMYNSNSGYIDVKGMLDECVRNIPSSSLPPSYFAASTNYSGDYSDLNASQVKEIFSPTKVEVQLAIINLIFVSDLQTTIELDFWFRVRWRDPRLKLPSEAFKAVHPLIDTEGFDITPYIRDEGNPMLIWLPDLFFYKGLKVNVNSEFIKIFPNGEMFWARQIYATFIQPEMSFKKYPLDFQNFSIVVQSWSFDAAFLEIQLRDPALEVVIDYKNNSFLGRNQLWDYKNSSSFLIEEVIPIATNPERTFVSAYINITFQRRVVGILARLIVPIVLFMLIVGFSFYSSNEQKVDVTLQMLLIICAIYLIIGGTIPQIGYLSLMDKFLDSVFLSLTTLMFFHFLVYYLRKNEDIYPLFDFIEHLVVHLYRSVWLPLVLCFLLIFFDAFSELFHAALYTSISFSIAYSIFNYRYCSRSCRTSILRLRRKKELHDHVFKLEKGTNATVGSARSAKGANNNGSDKSLFNVDGDDHNLYIEDLLATNHSKRRRRYIEYKFVRLHTIEKIVLKWTKNWYIDEKNEKRYSLYRNKRRENQREGSIPSLFSMFSRQNSASVPDAYLGRSDIRRKRVSSGQLGINSVDEEMMGSYVDDTRSSGYVPETVFDDYRRDPDNNYHATNNSETLRASSRIESDSDDSGVFSDAFESS